MPFTLSKNYRLLFGSLGTIALTVQLIASRHYLIEFFSYFTILSNIMALVMFFYLARQKTSLKNDHLDMIRGAVTLYMVITGIVYWTLLRNNPDLAAYPWINTVAHGIMPIAVLFDWIWSPPPTRLLYHQAWQWLIFPWLFVAYSLIRGLITNWYPYFFLNPEKVGYHGVIWYVLFISFGAWWLALGLIKISRLRQS